MNTDKTVTYTRTNPDGSIFVYVYTAATLDEVIETILECGFDDTY